MYKKSIKLLILLASFVFLSCKNTYLNNNQLISTDILVDNCKNKDIYLVKVNNSSTYYNELIAGNISFEYSDSLENCLNNKLSINDSGLINKPYMDFYLESDIFDISSTVSRNSLPKFDIFDNKYYVGTEKKFIVKDINEKNYEATGICKYTSDYCNVWYISSSKDCINVNYDEDKIIEVGKKFDIFCQIEEKTNGSHIYEYSAKSNVISSQKRIDIIIEDLFDDANPSNLTYTFGYFDPNDFVTNNKSQAIFIDSYVLFLNENTLKQIYSTLVHEYNHLLNYVNKTIKNGISYSVWYTEMLSLITEDMFQNIINIEDKYSPKERLKLFVYNSNKGFINWTQNLDNYANAYAFGAYLARNFGGPDLITEIATNTYRDFDSINNALINKNCKHIDDKTKVSVYDDFSFLLTNEFQILLNTSSYNVTDNINHNPTFFTLNNSEKLTSSYDESVFLTGIDLKNYGALKERFSFKTNQNYYNSEYIFPEQNRMLSSYSFDLLLIKSNCSEDYFTFKINKRDYAYYDYFVYLY